MSANTLSKTFSAIGAGSALFLSIGKKLSYSASVAGGEQFLGYLVLQRSRDGGLTWQEVISSVDIEDDTSVAGTLIVTHPSGEHFRWKALAMDGADPGPASDDVITVVSDVVIGTRTRVCAAGSRAGATAGFVVTGIDTGHAATLPENKTASTLVVPVPLDPGETITAFRVLGALQAGTAKPTVLNASLLALTGGAAGVVETEIAAIVELEVEADTPLTAVNAGVDELSRAIVADETVCVLITGTTFNDAASTAEILGIEVTLA